MANNAEVNLRNARKIPPMRIDRALLVALSEEKRRRKSPSLASTIRVLLREALKVSS